MSGLAVRLSRHLPLAIVLALAAGPPACISLSSPAASQSASGEVLLGTFGTRAGEAAHPPSRRAQELDAHRLLEDAREDLSSGYVDRARQQLQALLERYGDTAAGREASKILARIDRGLANRPAAPEPRQRPAEQEVQRPAQPGVAAANLDRRRIELDQDLRSSAGDRVFFANGSADLGARARQVLAAQAAWLARHPDLIVSIESHADDSGGSDVNLDIARQRGEAVRQRLVEEGVTPDRIRVVAHGRERRIATCTDAACAAQNRRVITTVAIESIARTGTGAPARLGYGR